MIKFTVHNDLTELETVRSSMTKANDILVYQVMKDTSPYVPFLTGSLNARTQAVGNTIIYPGPYARYLYYGKVMVDSVTGKGPAYIPEVGYRFRKGAILKPTGRDLQFTKSFHAKATARWFEVSKARNLQKWLRIAKEAILNGK